MIERHKTKKRDGENPGEGPLERIRFLSIPEKVERRGGHTVHN
jgi:hypothetical protein